MRQPTSTPYPISDFIEWNRSGQLVIAPKFQRRNVWIPKAKSYLIDTILRGMPIPPLFIRLLVDPIRQQTVREVVDGQQRLRTVLEYLDNQFGILKVHNPELAGQTFADLSPSDQQTLLSYKFVCHILEDVSDADVLDIFARINTYTVRLNAQELRNAEYFGAFKQLVYELGFRHYAFWLNNRIFGDAEIARMQEAELVSELLVTMLSGFRETRDKDLREFYGKFDDAFPEAERWERQFDETIDLIGNLFLNGLAKSQFRREPMFFSLFILLFDARWGLPSSKRKRLRLTTKELSTIRGALAPLERVLTERQPPRPYIDFVDAARRATADPGKRRLRHQVLWRQVSARL